MGSRFAKYQVLAYVLCTVLIVGFLFIYDYVFPDFGMTRFVATFAFIEVAVMLLIKRAGDWVQKNFYYEIGENALFMVSGKNRVTFPWKDFSSVRLNDFDFGNLCPFEYVVAGKKMQVNQYLDNPWDLNCYIMDNIRPYVKIDEELYHQTDIMRK